MTHPLLARLTDDFGWPRLSDAAALDAFLAGPGVHCVFIPGDAAKNLETLDAAVIVPELAAAFPGRFDVAVVDDAIERTVRERFSTFPTPALVFVSDGETIGTVPRVRDWDEYIARIGEILTIGRLVAAD